MKIDLTIQSGVNCGLTTSDLESIANGVIDKLDIKKPHTTIEVFLVTNNKIQALNKKHRGKDQATDVLSFPQKQFPTKNEQTLGTIFIAPKLAKKEDINCSGLFVHGVLHLLGFNHETNMVKWREAETKIIKEML